MALNDTILFLDWDDTLLSSSFLAHQGLGLRTEVPVEVTAQLDLLEQWSVRLLESACAKGQVILITNSETGWVNLSARKFMPGIERLLEKVEVVSARSSYESQFPGDALQWKVAAMNERFLHYLHQRTAKPQVISIGDSNIEREAVHIVTNGTGCHTKSIKLADRPTIKQLTRQVELIINYLDSVLSHEGDLDLSVTAKKVPSPSSRATRGPGGIVEAAEAAGQLITA